jgi:hypothetical protein
LHFVIGQEVLILKVKGTKFLIINLLRHGSSIGIQVIHLFFNKQNWGTNRGSRTFNKRFSNISINIFMSNSGFSLQKTIIGTNFFLGSKSMEQGSIWIIH